MRSTVTVIPLRERPELCAFFARQFEIEWPDWYGPNGKADAAADLKDYANPAGELPVGVVALDQSMSPVGIAALRATSIASHSHLGPWATAGFVIPERRREGIGADLLAALVAEAARLGHPFIFCATASAVSLLQRDGWTQIDTVEHDGESQFVFRRAVPSRGFQPTRE
jgi:GNAT superfamily N-acetyltransferase